ncbi:MULTISPECIES: SDR family oxidoreductase [Sphingobium]|uniref:Short-chain dehydrogenase n=2 Tax=Sphingobium cupriresistens TaxID=1132417 RepID=A0A0J7XKH4_9SPHN|nr:MULTISPECIES: SDR family NAD(P)-dependent oxidoreductase [Sphingobium]KMS52192.1 short-chain dehydrogenase [Sphingobium cupriresistens LL01]MBJ7378515.1 SDR family NAD(P)-dependent oxidoreductase [Sphingobium sp.]RYM09944.1 SDR family NAD(P)-dependent oxidoreductase [Sphingobium cupriresistens]
MTQVAGRTAFITGGGSGVGLGQAKVFAQAGCKVAIADIRQDHLDEAMAWFDGRGHDVMAVKLDITDRAAYARAADDVEAKLGPVELLFNTAGVSIFGPLQNATYDDWDWQLDVNLKGVINGIQTFVPRMIERGKGGHIVNTASMSAFVALKGTGIYCTSKMAIRGLSECLALDLADHGIGVSMLCPGAVNSNIHEAVLTRPVHQRNSGYYGADPDVMAHLKQVIAVGMEPEVLARYVLKGVEADQLYILPYPEFRGTLEDIHERVMAAVARPQDDPDYAKRVAHGVPGGEKREKVES